MNHLVTVLHQYPAPAVVMTTGDDRKEVLRNARALAETDNTVRVYVNRAEDGELIATYPEPGASRPNPWQSPERAPFDPQPTPSRATA